ncbi:MAG: hypothetical protein WA005_00545 [Candidatus Binataceae bacterium]
MLRFIAGAVIVAAIAVAIAIGVRWYQRENQALARQAAQIADLSAQLDTLQRQNAQLNTALDKVQSEEERLARDNEALRKALEQARLTGKAPGVVLPYPPK